MSDLPDHGFLHEETLDNIEQSANEGQALGPAWTLRLLQEYRTIRQMLEEGGSL
jgi:hypothetical protein